MGAQSASTLVSATDARSVVAAREILLALSFQFHHSFAVAVARAPSPPTTSATASASSRTSPNRCDALSATLSLQVFAGTVGGLIAGTWNPRRSNSAAAARAAPSDPIITDTTGELPVTLTPRHLFTASSLMPPHRAACVALIRAAHVVANVAIAPRSRDRISSPTDSFTRSAAVAAATIGAGSDVENIALLATLKSTRFIAAEHVTNPP